MMQWLNKLHFGAKNWVCKKTSPPAHLLQGWLVQLSLASSWIDLLHKSDLSGVKFAVDYFLICNRSRNFTIFFKLANLNKQFNMTKYNPESVKEMNKKGA